MSKQHKFKEQKRAEKLERQNKRRLAGIAIALCILALLWSVLYAVMG